MDLRHKTIFVIFFLLALPDFASATPVSASIPLHSWIYPSLDKLAGLGLIESSLQGSRPFTRLEAARQTLEARDKAAAVKPSPVAYEILQRLEQELRTSLDEASGGAALSYLQPIRGFRFDAVYQEGPPSTPSPTTRNNAVQHALNANNSGIDYGDGFNAQAIAESEARFSSFFLLNWRPLFILGEDQSDFTTLHGTATLGLGSFSIIAGRDSLWWGQGHNGSFILTNNAKPLDMVRITNSSPVHLPWIFRHLGPFRLDTLLSQLEADRHIAEPYLFGMRINLKPRPWFEVGASRAMMYGGEGQPGVGVARFLKLFAGRGTNVYDEPNVVNQIAAFDARIKVPVLWGAEIYGELGGEDEAGAFIAKKALLTGLYLPRIEPGGRLGLRLEYTDLNWRGHGPVWYRHGTYRSGYTYEKKIIGHHVGGDARDYYGALEYFLPNGGLLKAGIDIQRRGLSTGTVERHVQPFIAIDQPWREAYRLSARYAFDRVTNAGYVHGEERTDHFAQMGVSRSW
jgi:hypothetical protein